MKVPEQLDGSTTQVRAAVSSRYAEGAQAKVDELCCPVNYESRYLEALPAEILERDYGCGDPSRHLKEGETVLDLGSGAGKICYIASQIVGSEGRVIGVDMTDEMLDLARRHQDEMATAFGYANVRFRKGRIEDLALDLEKLQSWIAANPIRSVQGLEDCQAEERRLREEEPMIADDSVDVVVSNCVLNLVAPEAKKKLFDEIYRVLKVSGRAVISDIVGSTPVPESMQQDPNLWSGCIAGALQEQEFLNAFARAGFVGVEIIHRQAEPWRVVEGIEFRSMTLRAYKGAPANCCEPVSETLIYRGPFAEVRLENGRVFERGKPAKLPHSVLRQIECSPYQDSFIRLDCTDFKESSGSGGSDCCA